MIHGQWIVPAFGQGADRLARDQVRTASHYLLGNKYLLEVAAQIGQFGDGRFTLTEVARAIGIERNLVDVALTRLEKASVIKRVPGSGREQPYERVGSVYWRLCQELFDELEQGGPTPPADPV